MQRHILALDTLYHHLFYTPGCDTTTVDQLKHDLVLWLTHHSFEELPDALEYYLANPHSDLEGNLAHLTFLDPWGVQVHNHLHQHPPSMGQVFPSHIWGVSRPI